MKTFDEEMVKEGKRVPVRQDDGDEADFVQGRRERDAVPRAAGAQESGGTLHGGVLGTLVDMSVATALRSALPLTSRMTTVEYKVNLLKPVSEGTITARGSVIRLGKTSRSVPRRYGTPRGTRYAFGSARPCTRERPVSGGFPGYNGGDYRQVEAEDKPVLKGES